MTEAEAIKFTQSQAWADMIEGISQRTGVQVSREIWLSQWRFERHPSEHKLFLNISGGQNHEPFKNLLTLHRFLYCTHWKFLKSNLCFLEDDLYSSCYSGDPSWGQTGSQDVQVPAGRGTREVSFSRVFFSHKIFACYCVFCLRFLHRFFISSDITMNTMS